MTASGSFCPVFRSGFEAVRFNPSFKIMKPIYDTSPQLGIGRATATQPKLGKCACGKASPIGSFLSIE